DSSNSVDRLAVAVVDNYVDVAVSSSNNIECDSNVVQDDNSSSRVVFDLVHGTTKYTLTNFDEEHNHELDQIEYKHLSKAEKKLSYTEHLFIIKAANANIGDVRAHNLYTGLKGSSSLVHGTKTEFKNFTRGVKCFIGDSNAQMLITRMEDKQRYAKDFSSAYFVENADLCGLFWADEVAKCTTKSLVILYRLMRHTKQTSYWLCLIKAMTSNKGCDVCIVSKENDAAPKVIDKERTSEIIEEVINLHKKTRMKGGPTDVDKPFICTIDSIGAKGHFGFYVIDKSSIGKNTNGIAINEMGQCFG
ncbi:hypothetical protein Tco_0014809, partial [Tanacetum coccineum]